MIYFAIEDSRLNITDSSYTGSETLQVRVDNGFANVRVDETVQIPLRVIRSDGFEITPDYNITVSDLNRGSDGFLYKKFYNRGSGGLKFKIKVLIKKNETWFSPLYKEFKKASSNEHDLINVLQDLIETMTPVKVVTDAIDIPNGNYIITDNPSRTQTYDNVTEWELEFTTYVPLVEVKYKNDNTVVKKAIKSAKAKKVASKKKKSKSKKTLKAKFSKCKRKTLVYSKKKKVVTCVKYLQKILKKQSCYTGVIDGWYGPLTVKAVKKFQKKYTKAHTYVNEIGSTGRIGQGKVSIKLKATGKVDKSTFKALKEV